MKYKKKPVIIDAIQWTGENNSDITKFTKNDSGRPMSCIIDDPDDGGLFITIFTLEGSIEASIGDYIIKGVEGEFYPCKPNIFNKTYEVATEDDLYEG